MLYKYEKRRTDMWIIINKISRHNKTEIVNSKSKKECDQEISYLHEKSKSILTIFNSMYTMLLSDISNSNK